MINRVVTCRRIGFVLTFMSIGAAASIQRTFAAEPSIVGASLDKTADHAYPVCDAVVDVSKPPYNARGDGQTDDTEAIQKAIYDVMGERKIVYLPNGTYLISKPILWSKKKSNGQDAWGFNTLAGQNPVKTIIRLKDGVFTDTTKPQSMMWCGGFGSADWFHNYVQDLTFDVGRNNPGAIGLQFYSNNTGAVRNVAIVSQDGKGSTGLDLAHRDMNGPLLVRNVVVKGFEVGIRTGASVNSQTFEQISLSGQSKYGFLNQGQSLSIRGILSENEVPAIRVESFTGLLDSKFIGRGNAKSGAAIEASQAAFFARGITTQGYGSAFTGDIISAPVVAEVITGKTTSLFGAPAKSLGLPAKETPEVPWDDPKGWAIVDAFGGDPNGQKDSSEAIQKAIDSGATTVFFPGSYSITKPVIVRGKVRRLLGTGGWLDYSGNSKPDLIIREGVSPVVLIEHFAPISGGIAIETTRTVALRSLETRRLTYAGQGDLFLEDVSTDDLRLSPGQHVWARQLNIENEGTHITNEGASLWILGYKTERGGTLLHSKAGARSEIFGNFSYTTTAGKLAPMFVTEDSSLFAFFNEVCYSGDPFETLIRETRDGVVKVVKRSEGTTTPYVAGPGKN